MGTYDDFVGGGIATNDDVSSHGRRCRKRIFVVCVKLFQHQRTGIPPRKQCGVDGVPSPADLERLPRWFERYSSQIRGNSFFREQSEQSKSDFFLGSGATLYFRLRKLHLFAQGDLADSKFADDVQRGGVGQGGGTDVTDRLRAVGPGKDRPLWFPRCGKTAEIYLKNTSAARSTDTAWYNNANHRNMPGGSAWELSVVGAPPKVTASAVTLLSFCSAVDELYLLGIINVLKNLVPCPRFPRPRVIVKHGCLRIAATADTVGNGSRRVPIAATPFQQCMPQPADCSHRNGIAGPQSFC